LLGNRNFRAGRSYFHGDYVGTSYLGGTGVYEDVTTKWNESAVFGEDIIQLTEPWHSMIR
jgi:hypothetical protein